MLIVDYCHTAAAIVGHIARDDENDNEPSATLTLLG
jgi:hypothetical protein